MANITKPFGLRPVIQAGCNGLAGAVRTGVVLGTTSLTYGIYPGDIIALTGSSDAAAGKPTVTEGTVGATNEVWGVCVGVIDRQDIPNHAGYRGTGTHAHDMDVLFVEYHTMEFLIRDDGSAALTKDVIGANANIIRATTGALNGGRSGMALDATTPAADATYQLHVKRLHQDPTNELAAYAIWVVEINLHKANKPDAGV